MFHNAFDQDEGGAKVDVYRVVKFLQCDVPNLGDAFSVSSIRDKDVGALAVLFVYLKKHVLDLFCGCDVDLVDGNSQIRKCCFDLLCQGGYCGEIAGIC